MLKSPPPLTTRSASRKPLRKATYVTVDNLVTSQYILDSNKLNEELRKLRSENDSNTAEAEATEDEKENVAVTPCRTDTPSTSSATTGVASLNLEGKEKEAPIPNAWANPLTSKPPSWQQPAQVLPPLCFKYHTQGSRLLPPRDGFNLCVLVGKVDIVVDKVRVDGSRVLVAEVQVGDNTGSISLRARDEQIDLLKQISKEKGAVVLRNCTAELHQRKYLRLAVSKWGKMNAYPDGIESTPGPPLSINEERNYSLVDLNLFARPKKEVGSILPNQSSTIQQHKFDSKQKQHHKHQQHGHAHTFEEKRSPSYYQRNTNRKYQNQRKQQQPLVYSPQRQYYQQQHRGGPASAVFYPSYPIEDANAVYSYQSHSPERCSPPPHSQQWPHQSPYHHDFNQRQHQQNIMYYELQQRHQMQMQMLQETQRRMMDVEQSMGNHQGIMNVESHESSEDYSVPSTIAMVPPDGSFPPQMPVPPPMGYQYSPPVATPMMSMLVPGEPGLHHEHNHQKQVREETIRNAPVGSPLSFPQRYGQDQSQADYGNQLQTE